MVLKKDNNKLYINNVEEKCTSEKINRFFSEENEKKYTQNPKVYAELQTLKVINSTLNNDESDTIKKLKHHSFCVKYDNLMFNLKFVITHNKLLILIWLSFVLCCYTYIHTPESRLSIFASLIVLTGILYTSFSKNLENGMYQSEINLLLNIMQVIIKNLNNKYSPMVHTHEGLIRPYEENKQNKEDYLLGAYEQYKIITNLSYILDTPEIVYLPADLKEEIQSLNDKNMNIMNALLFYLKTLCTKNIELTKVYLITENILYNREYKGFFLRLSMIHYLFDENEIDILNNKLNLNINKEDDNSFLLFDVGEDFEKLNTLIYKIYYLSFKKVHRCAKFNVFS